MTMLNTTTRYAAPAIRRGVAVFLARLGRFVGRVIAHRQLQANLVALRHLCDRDLKDIGICRCEIGDALDERDADSPADTTDSATLMEKSALSSGVFFKINCTVHAPSRPPFSRNNQARLTEKSSARQSAMAALPVSSCITISIFIAFTGDDYDPDPNH